MHWNSNIYLYSYLAIMLTKHNEGVIIKLKRRVAMLIMFYVGFLWDIFKILELAGLNVDSLWIKVARIFH